MSALVFTPHSPQQSVLVIYWNIKRLKGSAAQFLEHFYVTRLCIQVQHYTLTIVRQDQCLGRDQHMSFLYSCSFQCTLSSFSQFVISCLELLYSTTRWSITISHKVLWNAMLNLPITCSHIDKGHCIYCDGNLEMDFVYSWKKKKMSVI